MMMKKIVAGGLAALAMTATQAVAQQEFVPVELDDDPIGSFVRNMGYVDQSWDWITWVGLDSRWTLDLIEGNSPGRERFLQSLDWDGPELRAGPRYCGRIRNGRQSSYRITGSLTDSKNANDGRGDVRYSAFAAQRWSTSAQIEDSHCPILQDEAHALFPTSARLIVHGRRRGLSLILAFSDSWLIYRRDTSLDRLTASKWRAESFEGEDVSAPACGTLSFRSSGRSQHNCCNRVMFDLTTLEDGGYRAEGQSMTLRGCSGDRNLADHLMIRATSGRMSIDDAGRLIATSAENDVTITLVPEPWTKAIEGTWRLIRAETLTERAWPKNLPKIAGWDVPDDLARTLTLNDGQLSFETECVGYSAPIKATKDGALLLGESTRDYFKCRSWPPSETEKMFLSLVDDDATIIFDVTSKRLEHGSVIPVLHLSRKGIMQTVVLALEKASNQAD